MKRIIRFTYAAIKRHGAARWTVRKGVIDINTNYVVCVSSSEINGLYTNGKDYPYFVELSNGTKLLIYLHDFGTGADGETISEAGEAANAFVDPDVYNKVSFSLLNK